MMCRTIKKYGLKKDGTKGKSIIGRKIQYDTLEAAQIEADRQNALPMVFIKREAYKCKKCDKYHVGKTYEMLPNKEAKPKKDKFRSLNLKIVGKIDLTTINDKKWNAILNRKKTVCLVSPKNKLNEINGRELYGELLIFNDIWKFEFKRKILKVITPDKIRHVNLDKIYDERALRLYHRGNMLSKRVVRNYLKENFQLLM